MKSIEAYYKFLQKVNKIASQFNVGIDEQAFCSLYNENQRKWLNKNTPEANSDQVNNVQSIIKTVDLIPVGVKDEYYLFDLPKDWFASTDSYIAATKGECKNQKINARQIKSANTRTNLFYEDNKPSFEFEWTFFTIEDDKIKVFKDDFIINWLYFTYYREPKEISIAGGVDINNNPTIDIDPELGDLFVEQIINETALDFERNIQNQLGFQLNKERITTQN